MSEEALKETLRRELEKLEVHDADLAMLAIGELDERADVGVIAVELKRKKPYLFKTTPRAPLAMGEIPDALATSKREIEALKEKAKEGTDRAAMVRFMRARRGG